MRKLASGYGMTKLQRPGLWEKQLRESRQLLPSLQTLPEEHTQGTAALSPSKRLAFVGSYSFTKKSASNRIYIFLHQIHLVVTD